MKKYLVGTPNAVQPAFLEFGTGQLGLGMPLPQDLGELASALGVPVTAAMLAFGLVRGAKSLETDANPDALRYVSGLLTGGDFASFGKLGPTLIPFIFDRVFGSKPLSWKFISRSILATTIFWVSLGLMKGLSWSDLQKDFQEAGDTYPFLFPVFYVLDWVSLVKARWILHFLSRRYVTGAGVLFLVIDVFFSYLVACSAILIFGLAYWLYALHELMSYQEFHILVDNFFHLQALLHFFGSGGTEFLPRQVVVPSTLLTSIWTFLLIISGTIAQLLIPLDYLRRFTAWWFRDVETHPLTAIAKIGAVLILIGSALIKAARWI